MKRLFIAALLVFSHVVSVADVREESISCAMEYYSLLQRYADNPGDLSIMHELESLFDGKCGSVTNDIYCHTDNGVEAASGIRCYLSFVGAYTNKWGYPLRFVIDEDKIQYRMQCADSAVVTVHKHVYCSDGDNPVDFRNEDTMLISGGKIVRIYRDSLIINGINILCYDSSSSRMSLSLSYSCSSDRNVRIELLDSDGNVCRNVRFDLSDAVDGEFRCDLENLCMIKAGNYTVRVYSQWDDILCSSVHFYEPFISSITKDGIRMELLGVADGSKTHDERFCLSKAVLVLFSSGMAEITVLGSDLHSVYRRQAVRDYLRRLASVDYVSDISIIRMDTDSAGRITSMKVREFDRQ